MSIINKIVQQFPAEYALTFTAAVALAAAAANKRDAFWKRYNANEAFRKLMDSNYAYKRIGYFDFWLNSLELKPYLQPQFANAEVLLIEGDKVSCLSIKQVERALREARKDCEKFQSLVLEKLESIADIWIELERRLNEAI